jgi:hypothetical protein
MRGLKRVALAGGLAVALVTAMAGSALADYGRGAQYQVELSANAGGPTQAHGLGGLGGGGVWLWIALNADGTGDYAGSDCGHGEGAAADQGDVTWTFSADGRWVVISGVILNGLGGFPTTITVPSAYGHYTGTVGSFLTLPDFIPGFVGATQLQVAR